jgi:hypothetical protein
MSGFIPRLRSVHVAASVADPYPWQHPPDSRNPFEKRPMPQSETSHVGPSLVPHARWHGGLVGPASASAAGGSVAPAAGYHAHVQRALDKAMQETT